MADLPAVTVEVGFDVAGVAQNIGTDYASITWTDVTAAVRPEPALSFSRGRAAAGEQAAAGQLQVTFLNDDGDFTPGDNGGAYGAIHPRMPIQVSADGELMWVGFVTDVDWRVESGQTLVTFTASDIIAAAARTTCGPWLDKRITGRLSSGLVAYWPLTDPAPNGLGNSTSEVVPLLQGERLMSGINGGAPLTVVGVLGTLSCNVPTGDLSPDGQPNVAFAPTAGGGGSLGMCPGLRHTRTITSGEFAVSMWLRAEQSTDFSFPFSLERQSGVTGISTVTPYTTGGYLFMFFEGGNEINRWIPVGEWFHLYIESDGSTVEAYYDGVLINSVATTTVAATTYTLTVGAAEPAAKGGWSGQIGHVAMWNTTDSTRPAILANRGADLATAASRFTELVYVTPNPPGLASWLDADAGAVRTVSAQTTNDKTLLTLLQEVADAERGSVVASRDGKLMLLSQRNTAAPAAPVLTLSAAEDVLAVDGLFGVDDADVVNEVSVVLQPSGRTFTAVRTVDPGVESSSVQMWSTDDAVAQSLATALANADSATPRAPSLTLSMDWLVSVGKDAAAVALELGDTLVVTDLPASAPATSLTVQVRSISHTIGRDSWQIQVDTDPPLLRGVLDDGDLGVLDDTAIIGV